METTIEKTTVKINTKPVKDLIKTYVEKQKMYKSARKNATWSEVNGKITWNPMHPSIAQSEAYWNGIELRILYAAYTLLRGKSLKSMEQNYSETDAEHFLNQHKAKIQKTLEGMKQMSEVKE
jgi:hypothetical protein